jgi:hypothetical protein
MIELAALAVLAVTAWVLFSLALVIVKIVLWTILLPIRLLFGLLILPLLLLKLVGMAFGGLALLIAGPIVAIALLAGLAAVAVAVIAPLLPFLFVAFVVWFVVRASSSQAIARSINQRLLQPGVDGCPTRACDRPR